jgi:hypothetical protein
VLASGSLLNLFQILNLWLKSTAALVCNYNTVSAKNFEAGLLCTHSQRGSGSLKELAEDRSTTTEATMQPWLVSDVDVVDGDMLDMDMLAVDVGYRWELGERCCLLRFSPLVLTVLRCIFLT